jgi:hypothetical protein
MISFAYPYGVSGASAALVEAAGFRFACTTSPGVIFRGRRPYRLPRLYVGDWERDVFERHVRSLR